MDLDDSQWVVFRLSSEFYALPIGAVKEMVRMAEVSPLPGTPAYVRGLMPLRGRVLPVIDLRMRLGMESADDERNAMVRMLETREEEHRNWLTELENSVREHRAFTLAVDPHQCAFGRWYDTFQTQNQTLHSILRRFERPHSAIHAIAQRVDEFAHKDAFDDALALIERTRNDELAVMVQLFANTRQVIKELRREVVLIVRRRERNYALAVDAVESVETLALQEDVNGVLDTEEEHVVTRIARSTKEQRVVLVLDLEALVSGVAGLPPGLTAGPAATLAN